MNDLSDVKQINASKVNLSTFQKQFVASAVASGITSLVLSPLNVVKIRIQNNFSTTAASGKHPIFSMAKRILTNEGIGGFWNGGRVAFIQALPSSIVYMTTYEYLKREIHQWSSCDLSTKYHKYAIPAVSAALARTLAVTCVSPLELVRTIQSSGVEKSIFGIVRDITKETGVLGLYRGWLSTFLRDVPFSAMYFFTFEAVKPLIIKQVGQEHASVATFSSGALAGMVSALATHPFDVLKTQTQLSQVTPCEHETAVLKPSRHTFQSSIQEYKNWLFSNKNENVCCINKSKACQKSSYALMRLYREHGFCNGLYRGISIRLFSVMPAGAIMLTIYELVKKNI